MTNSRASQNALVVVLDNHLATGTEATYTYTPSTALDLVNIYKQIIVIITGKATATFDLHIKLNANTDYDQSQLFMDTTTVSGAIFAASSEVAICNGVLIDGAVSFHVELKIFHNNASDHNQITSIGGASHEGQQHITAEDQSTDTTITSIEIKTSTSTWIAGTEITTIGIKR